jgi:hypothetical protein
MEVSPPPRYLARSELTIVLSSEILGNGDHLFPSLAAGDKFRNEDMDIQRQLAFQPARAPGRDLVKHLLQDTSVSGPALLVKLRIDKFSARAIVVQQNGGIPVQQCQLFIS